MERIFIDERTGRLVVVEDREDDLDEPSIVFHPVCRADELAWWLNIPGQLVRRGEHHDKR